MNSQIQYEYNSYFNGKEKGKCFQILGFDILIDENLKPWLLEINEHPSLSIDHDAEDQYRSKKRPEISKLDLWVKKQVIEDAIRLVLKPQKTQLAIGKDNYYKGYKQVYADELDDPYELFTKILKVFKYLSGYKFQGSIKPTQFNKLAQIPRFTNENFMKVNYDLYFKSIMRDQNNSNQMDLNTFIIALEGLCQKLEPTFDEEDKLDFMNNFVQRIMNYFDLE